VYRIVAYHCDGSGNYFEGWFLMKLNDSLQWIGAVFIIIGHVCNSIGPDMYPYNIVAFTIGTLAFMIWTIRVKNRPQFVVNAVSIGTCLFGLVKAYA
jgi:hypothetical protein